MKLTSLIPSHWLRWPNSTILLAQKRYPAIPVWHLQRPLVFCRCLCKLPFGLLNIFADNWSWYSRWGQPKRNKSATHYYCRCARYARIWLEGLGSSFEQCGAYVTSLNRQNNKSAWQPIKILKKRRKVQERRNVADGTNPDGCKIG